MPMLAFVPLHQTRTYPPTPFSLVRRTSIQ